MSTVASASGTKHQFTAEERKVVLGTMAGTTIEWYDFFIYAQAAALVFAPLFFEPATGDNAGLARILSLATIGISFLFRPLGAIIAGRYGDRLGRKKMLVITLLLMGGATVAIGLLPTYEQIGVAAPIILLLLRIVQGFSAGGEWGGAALMAVEHAPVNRRGLFGSAPQIGVAIGLILSTGILFTLSQVISDDAFASWGWRIPFLLSIFLIAVGTVIRRSVEESPLFEEMLRRKKASAAPLRELFRYHAKEVLQTAFVFAAMNAAGYLLIAFFIGYATTALEMSRGPVLMAIIVASVGWLVFTIYGGSVSDRIGRVRTFQIGYVLLLVWQLPMFWLVDTGNIVLFAIALIVMSAGLGLTYGPQPAMYAEMFPTSIRYSGISIGYALGAILGGAFAPTIAEILLESTGWSGSIGLYIMALSLVALITVSLIKETRGNDLHVAEAEADIVHHEHSVNR